MTNVKIELGDKVKDQVTGFSGIVISRTEHITGCDVCTIDPGCDKEGKPKDSWSFDVTRLKIVKKKAVSLKDEPKKEKTKKVGCNRTTKEIKHRR